MILRAALGSYFVVVITLYSGGCSQAPMAAARRVETRADLIGGPRALGEVGDWLLQNDKARFIIQDEGFSRGFGVYGGALLDADIVRPETGRGDSVGGTGKDNFGEMFPAFFLQALAPADVPDPNGGTVRLPAVEIERDGSDGGDAILVVRGTGGDFIALTQRINETLLSDSRDRPQLLFTTRYILHPGASYLEMTTTVQNIAFPPEEIALEGASFGGAQVPTPFGDVVLFGAGNKVFAPNQAGFDIRYSLEDIYAAGTIQLPAIAGLHAEFLASASTDVSYGLLAKTPTAPTQNFVAANPAAYPGGTDHSLQIPFIASAFTGVFQVLPPPLLDGNDGQPGGGDETSFTRYFMVGDGDVAAISDQVYQLLGEPTGKVVGFVHDSDSKLGVVRANIIILGADGQKVTHAVTREGGRFQLNLRPGSYQAVVQKQGSPLAEPVAFDVAADGGTELRLVLTTPAELVVSILAAGGGALPGKVTLVGQVPVERQADEPRTWLFDLSMLESWRYTDLGIGTPGARATEYIESFDYTADGQLHIFARPGRYRVVVGRGIEYDRVEQDIELFSGKTKSITAQLNRVVDTTGYVGADFHLHSKFSLDSSASIPDRLASFAGEGLEVITSTDHNFVVDYAPVLEQMGMQRWLRSIVGLELTTIDRGHFNGFPLQRGAGALSADPDDDGEFEDQNIASRTYGSFEWALRSPGNIFTQLRTLGRTGSDGAPLPIVLQVNHPRDSILGYFDQYGVNADDFNIEGQSGLLAPDPVQHPEFSPEAFSFDFDAIEVFNGKRIELIRSLKVPAGVTRDPVSCCPLVPGEVLREGSGVECSDDVPAEQCNCAPALCDAQPDVCDAHTQAQLDSNRCAGDVAFPGVFEDWMKLLQSGKRVIGTANSDSHSPDSEEPGSPRSYIRSPTDDPAQVSPEDVVAAFTAGDLLLTNGPFVRINANGVGMGGTATGNSITVEINVEQAPWVRADRVRIYRDGEQVADLPLPEGSPATVTTTIDFPRDGFLMVEVIDASAQRSLFPSIYPNEIPPLQFTDVIGSLGASFGFSSADLAIQPTLVFATTPYALTNPVWIDADGDGVVTPSRTLAGAQASTVGSHKNDARNLVRPVPWVPTEAEADAELDRQAFDELPRRKQLALSRLPRWLWPSNDPSDIRRVLMQFVKHAHAD